MREESLRWDPYVMMQGQEFHNFWNTYLNGSNKNILYVLGEGFDPRMCSGFEEIINCGGNGVRDCHLIKFSEGEDSPSMNYGSNKTTNRQHLLQLLGTVQGNLIEKEIQMWVEEPVNRRGVGSRNASKVFSNINDFKDYTDILVDISSMPRGIYFSLVGKCLFILDEYKKENPDSLIPNLHIIVAENPSLDEKIEEEGIVESASYIHGFSRDVESESYEGLPLIWMPILGEAQYVQLEKIHLFLNPEETCPILPSPSLNPRRGDNLIASYRNLLFDSWRVEKSNIIYASEQNPFEVYRQIYSAALHYDKVLGLMDGCKIIISALSSKLLSIGGMLAVYELKANNKITGIAQVETQGYRIKDDFIGEEISKNLKFYSLWLVGECYDY